MGQIHHISDISSYHKIALIIKAKQMQHVGVFLPQTIELDILQSAAELELNVGFSVWARDIYEDEQQDDRNDFFWPREDF